MFGSYIAARISIFCFAFLLVLGQSDPVFAQHTVVEAEEAIQSLEGSDDPEKIESLVGFYNLAAGYYLEEGNHEKAIERMQLGLQLCRDQKIDTATDSVMRTIQSVMTKTDPTGTLKFLKSQLSHPNASEHFKKEILKALVKQLDRSGDLIAAISMAKSALEAVQKQSPGTVEEVDALLEYSRLCDSAKFFDLGLESLKRAQTLAVKLNRTDILNRITSQLVRGLSSIDKYQEADEVLTSHIARARSSEDSSGLPLFYRLSLARIKIRLGEFAAAEKLISDIEKESIAKFGNYTPVAQSAKATCIFASAVADGSTEKAIPVVIETLEQAIESGQKIFTNPQMKASDYGISGDLLTLAAFEAIAGKNEAAMKKLDRVSNAIDFLENSFQRAVAGGATGVDETGVMIADQRVAVAELRQLLLVRGGKYEEALLVAEQSRGIAQAQLLKSRMGVEKGDQAVGITDVQQIQDVADSQQTTLVYYSLVHSLNPSVRESFSEDHAVNSPQYLYIWVVRPQQKIEFVSQVLPVRINDLVSVARDEILGVMDDADEDGDGEVFDGERHS